MDRCLEKSAVSRFLFTEVTSQQTSESLAVTGFVASHLVNGKTCLGVEV